MFAYLAKSLIQNSLHIFFYIFPQLANIQYPKQLAVKRSIFIRFVKSFIQENLQSGYTFIFIHLGERFRWYVPRKLTVAFYSFGGFFWLIRSCKAKSFMVLDLHLFLVLSKTTYSRFPDSLTGPPASSRATYNIAESNIVDWLTVKSLSQILNSGSLALLLISSP